ncbi:hypothetical protein QJS04_geneDACA017326 [Acorus gramineus]|uniref:C2H2-type domain-containing protein n=1 Tax=Acorus gramineus TaxID=55184 RepID=A0AAV9BC78_ACOGR|nr:hypothetical protein QJS04_geneDACA017326 [Acorus gramineus]
MLDPTPHQPLLLHHFLSLLFMALSTPPPPKPTHPKPSPNHHHHHHHKKNPKHPPQKKAKPPSSWEQFKSLLTCRSSGPAHVHDPSKPTIRPANLSSSCRASMCSLRDVVHGNTRVVHHRSETSPETSSVGQETSLLSRTAAPSSAFRSAGGGCGGTSTSSSKGLHLRRLSGCYECHTISEPSRYPVPRTICVCSDCGEVFTKSESLEVHQALRHAVSELGPEDSGRNIVEIIFKSSWLKKESPMCKIERILKVHNTQRTITRFEDYRESVKSRCAAAASSKNPSKKAYARCAADGNELLRFHCTTLTCHLGARGSTALCASFPNCGVCTLIRHGFKAVTPTTSADTRWGGVRTTASSGQAHDSLRPAVTLGGAVMDGRRAMLVCRVIAGRVRRAGPDDFGPADDEGGHDSVVAGHDGLYANLEELFVFNPRAILPCFVVIYRAI